jgi:hypothetical protein
MKKKLEYRRRIEDRKEIDLFDFRINYILNIIEY